MFKYKFMINNYKRYEFEIINYFRRFIKKTENNLVD